jgi:ABC-type transporter Mla maintaining outer membrane lipid asymmetry permease subunit MlaE
MTLAIVSLVYVVFLAAYEGWAFAHNTLTISEQVHHALVQSPLVIGLYGAVVGLLFEHFLT